MKTKLFVGIVGVALLLGLMLGCSTGGDGNGTFNPPTTGTIMVSEGNGVNTAQINFYQGSGDTKEFISIFPGTVEVAFGIYTLEFTFTDDSSKLSSVVTVDDNKTTTVSVKKLSGVYSVSQTTK